MGRGSVSFEDFHHIDKWVERNKEQIRSMETVDVVKLLFADTGLKCGRDSIDMLRKIHDCRKPQVSSSGHGARSASQVLAKELIRLMNQLGVTPCQDLTLIAAKQGLKNV